MKREIQQDHLGPIGVNLHSKYLLVAGYLSLSLIMPSFAQAVHIEDIFVQIEQTFELQSMKDPSRTEKQYQTILVKSMKSKEGIPGAYQPGQELSVYEQFRLPDGGKIRPSTAARTQVGLRVSHKLAVCIHYTPVYNNPERETRKIKIAIPATFSSCCGIFEALQLPAYSRQAAQLDKTAIAFCSECLVSLQQHDSLLGLMPVCSARLPTTAVTCKLTALLRMRSSSR